MSACCSAVYNISGITFNLELYDSDFSQFQVISLNLTGYFSKKQMLNIHICKAPL